MHGSANPVRLPLGAFHAIYRGRLARFDLSVPRESALMLTLVAIAAVATILYLPYRVR